MAGPVKGVVEGSETPRLVVRFTVVPPGAAVPSRLASSRLARSVVLWTAGGCCVTDPKPREWDALSNPPSVPFRLSGTCETDVANRARQPSDLKADWYSVPGMASRGTAPWQASLEDNGWL